MEEAEAEAPWPHVRVLVFVGDWNGGTLRVVSRMSSMAQNDVVDLGC